MPDTWLKKKLVCAVIVLFIGLSIFPGMSSYNQVLGNTIYVDDDAVPGWYDATHVKTIQEGILNATIGETIYVYSGIYVENVVVNKTVNLVGENKNTTIVDGNESGEVMLVKGTWPFGNVSIRNFKIVNCSMSGWHGVTSGIRIENCSNNTVSNCIFLDCYDGLYLESSWNNIVGDNSFDINVNYGNITFGNNSIRLYYADNNTIFGNTINNSTVGIHLAGNSRDNKIYHNNFVNNLGQASDDTGNNTWDNGYPSGGNYWDDFDEPSEGAYDNNSDLIVDSPYYIYSLYGNVSDRYPLINPWNGTPPPNNPPNTPSTPSGPITRETGQSGSYSTSASDPDGDQVQYRFDWDADGSHDYSTWTIFGASGHTGIVSNSWSSRGMYVVKSQARDEHLAESSWSSGLTVVVSLPPNNPPVADAGGPYTGVVDEPITFDGSGSFDSDGSIVGYRWDWKNDGGWDTDWLVNPKKNHTYDSEYYGMARLEVKDNMGATDIDTAIVDVEENQQPIVDIISPEEKAMVSGTISINGIASDPNGNNTLESVEVKIDDGSWNTADGTTSWNYSWDTTLFDYGFHTIYARSFDGEVYSDECSVNVNVTNTMSDVIVDEILGGFRVSARIKNNGTSSAYDVNWSIELEGGFIIIGGSSEGVISELVPGETKTIRQTTLYGIGRTTITVTVGDATKQANGFILGPLVLNVQEI